MEKIPLIKLKKEKTINETRLSLETLLKQVEENKTIYILDIHGIEKDKPNLCIYQKISASYDLWIDNGPRTVGDIVDTFMAGATKVTIRKELCPKIKISDIREITENQIYTNLNIEKQTTPPPEELFYQEADGIVNFNSRENFEKNQKYVHLLKKYNTKNNLYCYEHNIANISFWKKYNIKGLIIDTEKQKEFNNNAI